MSKLFKFLSLFATLPGLCIIAPFVVPALSNAQTAPRTSFPDVPTNYWAQPFIQRLSQKNILAGYPDGRFRPEQTMQRDELAAVIRKAFNQPPVRQIESGSVYKDVSQGYWAERPIESASEQGFLSGDSQGNFRPNQPVTKAQAIVALNQGLNLSSGTSTAIAPEQQRSQRTARRPVFVPIAITSLMQSVLLPKAQAAPTTGATTPAPVQPVQSNRSASAIVNDYYTDASSIPKNYVSDVAAATKQNIVVNYPNPRVLNPNKPATRAEIAALVHQSLVNQRSIEPLANNAPANQYVVRASNNK